MTTIIRMKTMIMPDAFILRIILAGAGVALAAGPIGCFVLWRRMVYFGDAVSHAAILGVALALAVELPVVLGVLLASVSIALIILRAEGRGLHTDTLLGVAAHSALAIGLVAVSFLNGVRVDLMSYLIGDILSVGWVDVAVIWAGAVLGIGLLIWRWTPLLLTSLNPEFAYSHGYDPKRESLIYTLALAVLVAVAIKVVGALLITALLIIPAATARLRARTPEQMAITAALAGITAAFGGIAGSFRFDTPTGPSIVVSALLLLLLTSFTKTALRLLKSDA